MSTKICLRCLIFVIETLKVMVLIEQMFICLISALYVIDRSILTMKNIDLHVC